MKYALTCLIFCVAAFAFGREVGTVEALQRASHVMATDYNCYARTPNAS